jgi:signal transduction histidine kinase/DNA-binding NarL/FixJ family response regulator
MKKFLASYSMVVLFAISGATVLGVSLYYNALVKFCAEAGERQIRQRLLETAKRLSARITAEKLDVFRAAEDMERPDYQALRLKLVEFAKDADVHYVYFLREENGKMQYIVDNDFDEKTRVGLDRPPEDKENVASILPALEGKVGVSALGVYMKGWDGLLTGYAPIYYRDGRVGAILGVDVNDEDVLRTRRWMRRLGIMQIAAIVIVCASGGVGYWRDRREAGAANEANEAKTRFLSRMSHEIRTPMNAILGMSDLALRAHGQPRELEYLTAIKHAGTKLLAIVNDILDFSKVESGKFEIRNEPYEAASLFSDVLTIIRVRLMEKNVRFMYDISPDIPSVITGDQTRVREVLLNLLSNAVKYTEKGFITFTVRYRHENGGSRLVLIFKVTDSGVGIRREDLGRLFGDFSRVGEAGNIEGTGLGLYITRQICRAMGGEVEAQSEYGMGSSFTATIRQASAAGCPPMGDLGTKAAINEEDTVKFSAPDFRVLVVDDNEANLKVATGYLSLYQMNSDACQSGKEALALIQERDYDLVLLDHMMPDMDGLEALAAIRALGGRFEKLPVAAFTANAMSGMKEIYRQQGFDDFLSKPIDLPKLNELVEQWVPMERRRPAMSGRVQPEMPGAARAELAARQLDLLNHYRWHFVSDLPADEAYFNSFSSLVETMDAPPRLRGDMAGLAAAGRRGDASEIRRLLPGVYEALALAMREGGGDEDPESAAREKDWHEAFRRLKTALDDDDRPGIDALMNALRAVDDMDSRARELYILLYDAFMMGETGKAAGALALWLKLYGDKA